MAMIYTVQMFNLGLRLVIILLIHVGLFYVFLLYHWIQPKHVALMFKVKLNFILILFLKIISTCFTTFGTRHMQHGLIFIDLYSLIIKHLSISMSCVINLTKYELWILACMLCLIAVGSNWLWWYKIWALFMCFF